MKINDYHDLGGTVRARTAKQTLDWLKPHLHCFGITRVANITGLDDIDIPVATCIRPNGKHLSVSQGKGQTQELAEISAIMEAIEAYHAENYASFDLQGSYDQLKNDYNLIDPCRFNGGFFSKKNVAALPLRWVETTHLVTQSPYYIPLALICLDSTQPHPEYAYFNVSSNGLAAGNTIHEALCHALYELIERDSLSQWQQLVTERRNDTLIHLSTIDDDTAQYYIQQVQSCGARIKVWDITSSLTIPAYHCAISDDNVMRNLKISTGTGCHLSKKIALSRAITEAVQTRVSYISGVRDDVFIDFYQHDDSDLGSQPYFNGKLNYTTRVSLPLNRSFAEDVNYLVNTLLQHGYSDSVYVNHTKPEIGIPVVHAFVPGLDFNGARM